MRVLHLVDSGGLYGAEVMLLQLMEQQRALGLEPILASIGVPADGEKPLEIEARRRGLRVEVFRMRPGPNWLGAFDILRYARLQDVELLHSHGYKANILFGLLPKRIRRLPLVCTVHGWTWTGGWNRMRVYEWLDGLSLRFADRVVLVNDALRNHPWLRQLPSERVAVVENGISLGNSRVSSTELRQDVLNFARQGFTIVAMGRLSPEKGFCLLIEAVAELLREGCDVRLAILGQGVLRGELEGRAKDLGIADRVFFAGYVGGARDYLEYFSLFCMPSLTEGMPMVLLEAMDAGVPILATRVGGIPRALDEGKAGLLVEAGNVSALRDAIAWAMRHPAEIARQIDTASRRVRELYTDHTMTEKYAVVYRQLLSKKNFFFHDKDSAPCL